MSRRALFFPALSFLLLCSSALPASGQEPLPARALLRVRVDYQVAAHGLRLFNQDLFVTTDRSVLANLVAVAAHITTENFWRPRSFSHDAPPAAYRELLETLRAVSIGFRDDDHCTVTDDVAPLDGPYDITWYGIGRRRAQLLIEVNGSSPLCPPELADLVNAINRFARAAGITEFGVPGEAGL